MNRSNSLTAAPRRIAAASIVFALAFAGAAYAASDSAGLRLNNLVTELVKLDNGAHRGRSRHRLHQSRDGWIYFAFDAEAAGNNSVELFLVDAKGETSILRKGAADPAHVEAMRLVTKGEHALHLRGNGVTSVKRLLVRTMPETHFVRYRRRRGFPNWGRSTGNG